MDIKQHDAFNRTWWSVFPVDGLVTCQHLLIERTGYHVVLKASSCLSSLMLLRRHLNAAFQRRTMPGFAKLNTRSRVSSDLENLEISGNFDTRRKSQGIKKKQKQEKSEKPGNFVV